MRNLSRSSEQFGLLVVELLEDTKKYTNYHDKIFHYCLVRVVDEVLENDESSCIKIILFPIVVFIFVLRLATTDLLISSDMIDLKS